MHDWEELTAPPPEKVLNAAKEINAADGLMDQAGNRLINAINEVSGTTMEDRIESFLNQLEDLRIDLINLKEKMERGKA